jgi:hypothetical protein
VLLFPQSDVFPATTGAAIGFTVTVTGIAAEEQGVVSDVMIT